MHDIVLSDRKYDVAISVGTEQKAILLSGIDGEKENRIDITVKPQTVAIGVVPVSKTNILDICVTHGEGPETEYEYFEGPYEVIPETTQQIILTRQKLMSQDMTVREIPYSEVSNRSGGYTASIG